MNIDNTGEQGDCPAWELVPGDFSPEQRRYISERIARAALRYPQDVTNELRKKYLEFDTVDAVETLLEAKAIKNYMTGNT